MENKCPQCGATLPTGVLGGLCPACLLKQGAAPETSAHPETAPFQPPSLEEIRPMFPQLEILAFIGKGGMGAVYQARQPALDRLVALKILPPQAASGAGFAERFNREARALARLSHPNIVAVHEFGQVNGMPFFIMEFVDGLNLRQLERAGKLSPREALQIVPQICEALQFAHEEGIVHRDIKPENILLDKKGRVKIADFGIAKIMDREADAGITETRGAIGTPQYMAPEQVEKPETVDHRADIFSLGVVFYEMLTGELPLGKFAPPSRKVEVDVRLDDVVLRALEKEPERRYQQASQVKTAVETIAGTTKPPPGEASEPSGKILTQDYVLDIGSCLRRGWGLVRSDFWPIVGVAALMLLLVQAASSTAIGIVAGGPLMGGLWLYLLKRARGEPAGMETAFTGFRIAFVDLFLAGFVTFLLTLLGFFCLILPGIYLAVAWMFALILVIDKRLDFWSAMELSRRMVAKHWFKAFGFFLVLLLMNLAGILLCGIGVFFTAPIALAATVFAYEDIFGRARPHANEPSAQVGPFGTALLSGAPVKPASIQGGIFKPVAVGLTAVVFLLGLVAMASAFKARKRHGAEVYAVRAATRYAKRAAEQPAEASRTFAFGPVVERVIEFTNAGRRALNLASGNYVTSEADRPLEFNTGGIAGLRGAGIDLFLSDAALNSVESGAGFVENVVPQLDALDWRALNTLSGVDREGPFEGDINMVDYRFFADRLKLSGTTDPLKNDESIRGTNLLRFVTRDGTEGILQISGLTGGSRSVMVRYKLLNQTSAKGGAGNLSHDSLAQRVEAAGAIDDSAERSRTFARLAVDAANAGEVELVKASLKRINDSTTRNRAAFDSARLLARRQLRRQGIEIARTITDNRMRDRAMSELAQ